MTKVKIYPKLFVLVLVFLGSCFLLLLGGGFNFVSLAACPAGQSCPAAGGNCVSSCDAWYDDQYCFCFCFDGMYTWTCGCGTCGGGGCFPGETEITLDQKAEKIKNLDEGDKVTSFNPETGEMSENQVTNVYQLLREGYFELETESGKKVKVTGEHPFFAVEKEKTLISEVKATLSQTLTYQLIIGLQRKLVEVLK